MGTSHAPESFRSLLLRHRGRTGLIQRDLAARAGQVRARTVKKRDDLTAQEGLIARLARQGLSNPEIGARLLLSRHTMEWHLNNIFAKLGIRSRGALATALSSADSTPIRT